MTRRQLPCSGHLTDIEHIVFLMQENRSFDHYFGTLSATRGFDDLTPLLVFEQAGLEPENAGSRPRRYQVLEQVSAATVRTRSGVS